MSASAVEHCPWCGSPITHAKFLKVQAAIREDERKKLAEIERAERAKIAKQLELLKKSFEEQRKKDLADARRIYEKDRQNALLRKEAEFAREREAMQKRIAEMSRRVKKAGGEVGEGAELDLYEELRGAFPDDNLVRVKGKPGVLLLDVRYKGKSAGKIIIDSTPRAAWQHAFVTKLRQKLDIVGKFIGRPKEPAIGHHDRCSEIIHE